jgi:hypothetical protein
MCPRNGVFKLFLNSNTPPDKKTHQDEEAKKITTTKSVPRTGSKNWLIFKY